MSRFYYFNNINDFLRDKDSFILGELAKNHEFALEEQQRNAWNTQIELLKKWLKGIDGHITFEFSIPRMGKRIDCILISGAVLFAIEFKIGSASYDRYAIDQVIDYALDLKNFHEQSHDKTIVPILICTASEIEKIEMRFYKDGVAEPILSNGNSFASIVNAFINHISGFPIDASSWINSAYKPTPTIIEAAQALYLGHSVDEISRSDAGAINLSRTKSAISEIIRHSKINKKKSICFLTGVPGSGKTLAGLNLANAWHNEDETEHAVFLSGNGPLVEVLREALARNEVVVEKAHGNRRKKSEALSKARAFIQNIHHFRDDALEQSRPPIERVVVFDEAQRAWDVEQTSSFMKRKGKSDFNISEPEFLIGVMDRHVDWATIVCLIGGGQEINTGEAGLQEWFESLNRSFPDWNIYISDKLTDHEYTHGRNLINHGQSGKIQIIGDLHLSVSIRSFRSERVSDLIKASLDCDMPKARELYKVLKASYPILVTRNLKVAKNWLKSRARGSERFGLVASSNAMRLKPYGINMQLKIDPKNWFLNGRNDIRSSYYLEDVASEFDIQGLELDWVCVAWDADLRHDGNSWQLKLFRGTRWQNINDPNKKRYLLNAYRVLLTRARQGMVIFVPTGSQQDETRLPSFYDDTYNYFRSIGIQELTE